MLALCALTLTTTIGEAELNFREANIDDLSQLLDLEQKIIEAERPFNPSIKIEKNYILRYRKFNIR
jgi:hypothetical protein